MQSRGSQRPVDAWAMPGLLAREESGLEETADAAYKGKRQQTSPSRMLRIEACYE